MPALTAASVAATLREFIAANFLYAREGFVLTDDVRLLDGIRVERDGSWRGPTVAVTSTPSDQSAVERVLLELVRMTLSSSPYAQESSDGHSYTRPADLGVTRTRLARSLRPHRGPRSTPLRSGLTSARVTV